MMEATMVLEYNITMEKALCITCEDKPAVVKSTCQSCYYTARLGQINYRVLRKSRNFIRDGIGILTAQNGNEFIVDLDDFEKLKNFTWTDNGNGYAKSTRGYLHRNIAPQYKRVDHVNRDTRDNRKVNLREGHYINTINTNRPLSISGYRGVHAIRNKWQGRISIQYKKYYLGTFDTALEAAIKVHELAKKHNLTEFYPNPRKRAK